MNLKALPLIILAAVGTGGTGYFLFNQTSHNISTSYHESQENAKIEKQKEELAKKIELERKKKDLLFQTEEANKKLAEENSVLAKQKEAYNQRMEQLKKERAEMLARQQQEEKNTLQSVPKSYPSGQVDSSDAILTNIYERSKGYNGTFDAALQSLSGLNVTDNISYSRTDVVLMRDKYNLPENGKKPVLSAPYEVIADIRQHNLMIAYINSLISKNSNVLHTEIKGIKYAPQNANILTVSPEGKVGVTKNNENITYNVVIETEAGDFAVKGQTCSAAPSLTVNNQVDLLIDKDSNTFHIYPNSVMKDNISYVNCQALLLAE